MTNSSVGMVRSMWAAWVTSWNRRMWGPPWLHQTLCSSWQRSVSHESTTECLKNWTRDQEEFKLLPFHDVLGFATTVPSIHQKQSSASPTSRSLHFKVVGSDEFIHGFRLRIPVEHVNGLTFHRLLGHFSNRCSVGLVKPQLGKGQWLARPNSALNGVFLA